MNIKKCICGGDYYKLYPFEKPTIICYECGNEICSGEIDVQEWIKEYIK